jgi:glycerol-3-phosphate dehydrogenase
LKRHGLTGAAVFYDYVTTEPDRLTFSYALTASEHGAVVMNHVEAVAPLLDGRRVVGMRAKDMLGSGELEIGARLTVNATGSAIDRLLQPLGTPTRMPMLKAMNLVTRRDAGDEALGGRGLSGRNLFLVPWRDRAIFGTWESERACDPDDTGVDERDVASFMAELNQAFPALDLTFADITLVHHGVVPAVAHGDRVRCGDTPRFATMRPTAWRDSSPSPAPNTRPRGRSRNG